MDSQALDVLRRHRGRFVTLLLVIVVALLVGVAPMLADGTSGGMSCCAGDGGGKSMSGSSGAGNSGGNRPDGGVGGSGGNRPDPDRDRRSASSSGEKTSAPSGPATPSKPEPSRVAKEVGRALQYMADNPDVGNGNEVTGAEGYELGVAVKDAHEAWSDKKAKEREQREATEKAEREASAARAVADAKDLADRLKREQDKKQESQNQTITQP